MRLGSQHLECRVPRGNGWIHNAMGGELDWAACPDLPVQSLLHCLGVHCSGIYFLWVLSALCFSSFPLTKCKENFHGEWEVWHFSAKTLTGICFRSGALVPSLVSWVLWQVPSPLWNLVSPYEQGSSWLGYDAINPVSYGEGAGRVSVAIRVKHFAHTNVFTAKSMRNWISVPLQHQWPIILRIAPWLSFREPSFTNS